MLWELFIQQRNISIPQQGSIPRDCLSPLKSSPSPIHEVEDGLKEPDMRPTGGQTWRIGRRFETEHAITSLCPMAWAVKQVVFLLASLAVHLCFAGKRFHSSVHHVCVCVCVCARARAFTQTLRNNQLLMTICNY